MYANYGGFQLDWKQAFSLLQRRLAFFLKKIKIWTQHFSTQLRDWLLLRNWHEAEYIQVFHIGSYKIKTEHRRYHQSCLNIAHFLQSEIQSNCWVSKGVIKLKDLKTGFRVAMVAIVFASSGFPASAKTWRGNWERAENTSTLQFLDNKRVRYCFRNQCTVANYSGDPDRTIRFRWNNSRFKFKKTNDGYIGDYRNGSEKSTIFMK